MILKDNQTDLLQAGNSSIWIGSCSLDLVPDTVRLTGARVEADAIHITLFVPRQYMETFFRNVDKNHKISFMGSSVFSFEAFQVKGLYLGSRSCTSEEQLLQQKYIRGFAQTMLDLGIKNGLNLVHYYQEPSIAIFMKAEEVYEQTPKLGTGNKID